MSDQQEADAAYWTKVLKAVSSAEHNSNGFPGIVFWLLVQYGRWIVAILQRIESKIGSGTGDGAPCDLSTVEEALVEIRTEQLEQRGLISRLLPGMAVSLNTYFDTPVSQGEEPQEDNVPVDIGDSQQTKGHIRPKDKAGNAAPIEAGTFDAVSSDPTQLIVEKSADVEGDFSVKVAPGATLTEGTGGPFPFVTTSGDADLGDGVETIQDVTFFNVKAEAAKTLGTSFDLPEEQPDATNPNP